MLPTFSLEDAVDAYYTATTAKDVSILITVEMENGSLDDLTDEFETTVSHIHPSRPPRHGTFIDVVVTGKQQFGSEHRGLRACCRIAAVDIDCKRHKSLAHYASQDKEILASWSRATSTCM
jgi:hypothetical protein